MEETWFVFIIIGLVVITTVLVIQSMRIVDPVRGFANIFTLLVIGLMVSGQCSPEYQTFTYVSNFIAQTKDSESVWCNCLPILLLINFTVVIMDVYNTYISVAHDAKNQRAVFEKVTNSAISHKIAGLTSYLCILGMSLLLFFNQNTPGKEWKHLVGVTFVMFGGFCLHGLTLVALLNHQSVSLFLPPTTKGPVLTVKTEIYLVSVFFICYVGSAFLLILFYVINIERGAIFTEYVWLFFFAMLSYITTRSGVNRVVTSSDDSVLIWTSMIIITFVAFLW